ncbi:ABC transporter permease [Saccharothrix obliqua]|uniref:ABC transporter permease n=1 Tax=Saccharothrix obliqua TaxID=2861747 RepID=UPI001C5D9461|nr:ABC transporter permease [Saccharothrix obliqua]MBW4718495.1 FtsX-like permease family protein [Saccharothrix obliqua]
MSALGRVVRAGVRRKRVQTAVIGLATMMAVTASVLGGSLLVVSSAPFDEAFTAQRGAHVAARFAAPPRAGAVAGVTDSAGPFPFGTAVPDSRGLERAPLALVGRADPGGPVDEVAVLSGRWAAAVDEVVLSADVPFAERLLDQEIRLVDRPGAFTVVGLARSVSRTADAWVLPAALPAPTGYQVLYRLAEPDRVDDAVAAIRGVGEVVGAQSWLVVKEEAVRETAVYVPFLVAFGLLGLVMSVLIVGNVVAGAVSAGTRRIGVLKALGFTPAQVVRAHVAQALVPAAVGTAVGVLAGNLLAVPVLAETTEVYGTGALGVDPVVDLLVVVGVLGVVALTAWAGAARAGRLRTVEALAVGRTPRPRRGRTATRVAARLPVPVPVALGLARPFARPVRALGLVAAVVFGTTAVTFAVGLGTSLGAVQTAREPDATDVVIGVRAPEGDPIPTGATAALRPDTDRAAVTAAIDAQAGTAGYYGIARRRAAVAGMSGSVVALAFSGDTSRSNYQLISGTWFRGAGEAVVPTTFLTATATSIGDTVTLEDGGRSVRLKIVGEVFDTRNDGKQVLVDAASLPGLRPTMYHISVREGTDLPAYLAGLSAALRPLGVEPREGRDGGFSDMLALIAGLTALLTLLLVAVAGLGVLNTVLLDTRERVRDLGVHKAVGMTPGQTTALVVASVAVTGVVGGVLGVPAGVALHSAVLPLMAEGAGTALPASAHAAYHPVGLVLFALGGLVIAVLGALPPAGWAARTRTATALRAE